MNGALSSWRHFAGDPTPWGWAMVALYVAAVVLCLSAARGAEPRAAVLWKLVAFGLGLLGVNKQLDLQLLLLLAGKEIAKRQGWYESRTTVEAAFVAALVLLSLLCAAALVYAARRVGWQFWLAGCGLLLLDLFVLLRAAYFQRFVSRSFGEHGFMLELVGAGLVALGAQQYRASRRYQPARELRQRVER